MNTQLKANIKHMESEHAKESAEKLFLVVFLFAQHNRDTQKRSRESDVLIATL